MDRWMPGVLARFHRNYPQFLWISSPYISGARTYPVSPIICFFFWFIMASSNRLSFDHSIQQESCQADETLISSNSRHLSSCAGGSLLQQTDTGVVWSPFLYGGLELV
jgi:hypothetical protein